MKQCYNALVEYREPETNRIVIQLFISLPSRKDFPEYFEIIERPISMYEIRKRIESNIYPDERSCIDDFKLMFNNCKLFNEDLSQIFKDAVNLQNILMKRYDEVTIQAFKSEPAPAPSPIRRTTIEQNNSLGPDSSRKSSTPAPQSTNTTHTTNTNNHTSSERPTKRLKRDPDAPKRRLLTGYIIYAAEVRKEYVDRHPDQDFGFISRLIGNDWKALPRDLRIKYDQRALAHNKKIRERLLRESLLETPNGNASTNSIKTPKLSKRKLAMQMRLNQTSTPSNHDHDNSMNSTLNGYSEISNHQINTTNSHPSSRSPYKSSDYRNNHNHTSASRSRSSASTNGIVNGTGGKPITIDSSTQTAPIRFVEPSHRRRIVHSDNFRRYIEGLDVPNRDLLVDETTSERPTEPAESWLGSTGTGRHESAEAALWALRDFMLQDVGTMRWSMQPYLCY